MIKRDFNGSKLEAFKREFCERVEALPGVSRVEFIGSIATGYYIPGSSDLDVFVHGRKIPTLSKKRAVALVKELNKKYELGLERAPCQHPTPFFIDSPFREKVYRLLKGRMELRLLRATIKRIAPSYGLVWRIQERRRR